MNRDEGDAIGRAAGAIDRAGALLIGAGAGMGVDSGLPDFRGPEGFWRAYPAAERLGLSFAQLAHPRWFRDDPALAWGFYGQRRNLYRSTVPHIGFAILQRWSQRMPAGAFVFTSNVDGHFQHAGFPSDRIVECHGALERLQCMARCGIGIFGAEAGPIAVDSASLRASPPLPSCPFCGALARPNILMFGDWDWDPNVTDAQQSRFDRWLNALDGLPLAVIECGAGLAIPTVRLLSEEVALRAGSPLIRINPRDADVPPGQIGLALGSLEALEAIDRRLGPP